MIVLGPFDKTEMATSIYRIYFNFSNDTTLF